MTAAEPLVEDEDLVVTHKTVEVAYTARQRLLGGLVLVAVGVIIFFAWGLGARNGDAAFTISQFSDRWQVPDLRYPGGGWAMGMGVVVAVLGLWHLARGFGRRAMRWAVVATVLLFILAFLTWWATAGEPSLTGLVQQTIVSSVPYVLGALAGIVCERTGVINIAIEGQMLSGAFLGALVGSVAHSAGVGVIGSVLAGAFIALLLAVFAIRYLVNQIVLGVVLNTLALGLTNLGFHSVMATDSDRYNSGVVLSPIKIPLLGDIPVIGQALFNVNFIFYITYGLIVAVQVGLFRTRWGLRSRAVGEHPRAADTVGIRVRGTRYRNVLIGGLIAGLAGAALTVGGSGQFNSNISSGKGFIALACVIFGRWSPRGAIAAALLFGFADQLQTQFTIVGAPVDIPSTFLAMAPYVVTIIAVAGFVGRVQAPAADGEPYTKS